MDNDKWNNVGWLIFILGVAILSYCTGRGVGFNKGVEVTAKYADSVYQDDINQCESVFNQAVYYRDLYRAKYDSLNLKSE